MFLYILQAPESEAIEYVGVTMNPRQRLRGHIFGRDMTPRDEWVMKLKARGRRPVMTVVKWFDTRGEAELAEAVMIQSLRERGVSPTNWQTYEKKLLQRGTVQAVILPSKSTLITVWGILWESEALKRYYKLHPHRPQEDYRGSQGMELIEGPDGIFRLVRPGKS